MMPNRMIIKNEMYLVGNLQDYGKPYASLFLDREAAQLYIFVCMFESSDIKHQYIATSVSSDEVSDYMQRKRGLRSIFAGKESVGAEIIGQQVMIDRDMDVSVDNTIMKQDKFNPEFCYDKMKLKIFLKRFNAGAYSDRIVITSH